MHYDVELRELLYESDGTGGLQVTGSMWKPVRVFNKDTCGFRRNRPGIPI
jgi:hypothetical protein